MSNRAIIPVAHLDGHPLPDQAVILRKAFARQTTILRRQLSEARREHQATLDELEAARAEISRLRAALLLEDGQP